MVKKAFFVVVCAVLLLLTVAPSRAAWALSIGGVVRQPLNLTLEDLGRFEKSQVRVTELGRNGEYGGVFDYKGVSLKALLDMAVVQKEVEGYSKSINLAILVRNREGRSAVLSWGEVFYRNPSHAILALSATPVVPGVPESCGKCHEPSFHEPVLGKLNRKMDLPRLVMAQDLFTDRNLEGVTSIEVVDLNREVQYKESQRPSPATFSVIDSKGRTKEITGLSGYRHVEVAIKVVGSGRGYHGLRRFEGVPLRELLSKAGVAGDLDSAFLITSTDGYQSLLSCGEIILSAGGDQIVISEQKGAPKKFTLVVPHDTLADRMVKTVNRIEVISVKPASSKLYVIGVGCGDTSLITLEAISHMGKVDAFISPEQIIRKFAKYMGGKPVLFDPFSSFEPILKKNNPGLRPDEIKQKAEAQRAAEMKSLRETLAAGKSVAVLDWGDPTIYGGWQHWLEPEFAGKIEIIPGISALSAGNAMMGYNLACNQDSMIVTTPAALQKNRDMLKAVAEKGDPVAIYMGLKDLRTLVPLLSNYYPAKTPVIIAYKAGYSRERRLLKTDLGRTLTDTEKESEQQLGIIYIGPNLR